MSSRPSQQYAAMMTRSPSFARCAAAPLTPISPLARWSDDTVGGEACSPGQVVDVDLLQGQQIGGLEEVAVDA